MHKQILLSKYSKFTELSTFLKLINHPHRRHIMLDNILESTFLLLYAYLFPLDQENQTIGDTLGITVLNSLISPHA